MGILQTIFNEKHKELGAKMVDFGGWDMPVNYNPGVLQEHLQTRKDAGLFDVSHMGRFEIAGRDALPFLQYVLTNNAAALNVEESQYTIISDEQGFAVDDSYLYRFDGDRYILVVNASNREKDWNHFLHHSRKFAELSLTDRTFESAMLSLQGPRSKEMLSQMLTSGHLPIPMRNCLSKVSLNGKPVMLARTGYTGEPIGFELFMENAFALEIWDMLLAKGVQPVGLGARDTLRLEACLPLYGHEFGLDAENRNIPIFACPLAKFAVSFSRQKGDFIGRDALRQQVSAYKKIIDFTYTERAALPRIILPLAIQDRGIARAGDEVYRGDTLVGHITSGTASSGYQLA